MATFVFHEWNSGVYAVFDSEEKLNFFINKYQHKMIDVLGGPPQEDEDYSIVKCEFFNPNFDEWWNS